MPSKTIKKTIFHNDDVLLTLEYPEDLIDLTHLKKEIIESDFEAFARVLFDNILTKDKKNFKIVYDEANGSYDILIPMEE